MTFEEWWTANYGSHVNYRDNELILGPARAAWNAALAQAKQVATEAAKRYSCKQRRALCGAIADQIEQRGTG